MKAHVSPVQGSQGFLPTKVSAHTENSSQNLRVFSDVSTQLISKCLLFSYYLHLFIFTYYLYLQRPQKQKPGIILFIFYLLVENMNA